MSIRPDAIDLKLHRNSNLRKDLWRDLGRAGRWLAAAAATAVLVGTVLFIVATKRDYDTTLNRGWSVAASAVEILADNTARTIDLSRLVTERAADRIRVHGIDYFRGAGHSELVELADAAPMFGSVWVFNANGDLVANSLDPRPPRLNFSDRAFYPALKGGAREYIMGLTLGRISRVWFASYNRAVLVDGQLAAIVQASVHVDYYGMFAHNLDLGEKARFSIYKLDGTLVMRWPLADGDTDVNERDTALFQTHLPRAGEGRFQEVSGNATRMRVYRSLPELGLVAAVSVDRGTILAGFWRRTSVNAGLLSLAFLIIAGFAGTAIRATRRERAEALQRASAERNASAIVDGITDGLMTLDRNWRITSVNRRGEDIVRPLGKSRQELVGAIFWEAFPETVGTSFEQAYRRALEDQQPAAVEGYYPPLGSWFDVRAYPTRDGIAIYYLDITERKEAEQRLKASEAQVRGLIELMPAAMYTCDSEGRITLYNAQAAKAWGREPRAGDPCVRSCGAFRLRRPDGSALPQDQVPMAIALRTGRSFRSEEVAIERPDGSQVIVSANIDPILDGEGKRVGAVNVFVDITERKQAEEKIRFLMREVNHRSKNLLALVHVIARNTAAASTGEFLERFGERIQALAASHDLLVRSDWKGIELTDLVLSQLAHFRDLMHRRILLSGPAVKVTASAAQTIGMALHELATNAGKYGALSNDTGTVEVTWSVGDPDGARPTFSMCWRETGGPPFDAPKRSGFGTTVVTRIAKLSLGGEVRLEFAPAGLVWSIECDASRTLETARGQAAQRTKGQSEPVPTAAGGSRILLVEDEALLAMDLAHSLEEAGFDVLGPAASVHQALHILEQSGCDAAILDVNLGDETSAPVALELARTGTPFITVTGYTREQRPAAFAGAPLLRKPIRTEMLVRELKRCLFERTEAAL